MDCERCLDSIQEFIDGELASARRAELLEHVEACEACRKELKTLQALASRLEAQPLDQPSVAFEKTLAKRLASLGGTGGGLWARLRAMRAAPFALAAGLAVVAMALIFGPFGTPSGTLVAKAPGRSLAVTLSLSEGTVLVNGKSMSGRVALRERDAIVAKEGSQAWLRYEDGSKVKVKAGTELQVFDRKLFLKVGEVWVEVQKGHGRFEVVTPFAVAAVKGTQFIVKVAGGTTRVVVTEGCVNVKNGTGTVSGELVSFKARDDSEDVTANCAVLVDPTVEYIKVCDFHDPASVLHDTSPFQKRRVK